MIRQQRSLLAQLRAGILPLRIETGRFYNIKDPQTNKYRKLKAGERLCEVCKDGNIEDEYHFVCICSVYRDIRETLYQKVMLNTSNFNDMNDLDKFFILIEQ